MASNNGKHTKYQISPKLRHHLKREAEKDERKSKPSGCKYKSVKELFA